MAFMTKEELVKLDSITTSSLLQYTQMRMIAQFSTGDAADANDELILNVLTAVGIFVEQGTYT